LFLRYYKPKVVSREVMVKEQTFTIQNGVLPNWFTSTFFRSNRNTLR